MQNEPKNIKRILNPYIELRHHKNKLNLHSNIKIINVSTEVNLLRPLLRHINNPRSLEKSMEYLHELRDKSKSNRISG